MVTEHLRVLGGNARRGGELRRGIVLAVVERREDAGELSDAVPARSANSAPPFTGRASTTSARMSCSSGLMSALGG